MDQFPTKYDDPSSFTLLKAILPILYLVLLVPLVDLEPLCGYPLCNYRPSISIGQYLLHPSGRYYAGWSYDTYSYHLNFPYLLVLLESIIVVYFLFFSIIACK
jgi:hypothetical protein